MTNLGLLYGDGHGVPQDYAKAREWYEKAAEAGAAQAMTNLGVIYENGQGVPQDYAKAREWYEKGAGAGSAQAMALLAVLYGTGNGGPHDYENARVWAEKAAAVGNVTGMRLLAVTYSDGLGVPKDLARARQWYEKAAAAGDEMARDKLSRIEIMELADANRYAEALSLQTARAADIEAKETARAGKPGDATSGALVELAWYALFARKPEQALAASDRSLALEPDNLVPATNRAHALMFLDRETEARAAYLQHKDAHIAGNNKSWQQVIAEDFDLFRKAGLSHPLMAEIEVALGTKDK
jgi:uncharacterized protein YdaT